MDKKKYLYEGAFWFFEEGRQPEGAVEVVEEKAEAKKAEPQSEGAVEVAEEKAEAKKAEPQAKAVEPKNKARETKKK